MKNIYEKIININRSLFLFLLFTVGIFSSNLSAQCTGGRYYVRDSEPWGKTSNVDAMNAVFGSGNWTQGTFSTTASTIFSPANCYVMLEGSQNNSNFPGFITANLTLIQNWVAAGGKLFINAAPNYNLPSNPFSLGFGGVTISRLTGTASNIPVVTVTTTGISTINAGPNTPTSTSMTGGSYAHARIYGTDLTSLIDSTTGPSVLSYKKWGAGVVFFGGITQPDFHLPLTQAVNTWKNIFSYVNTINLYLTPLGNAINFDGTDDYISTATSVTNPQNFTLSAWVKSSSLTGGGILGLVQNQTGTPSGSSDRVLSFTNTGALNFYVFNGAGQNLTSPLSYNDGKYHHVAASISASNGMRLYVDGTLVASNGAVTSAQNFTGYWRLQNVSNPTSSLFFDGNIDQVKIYGSELNLAGIRTDMFDTSSTASGLTYYYNCDTASANGSNGTFTTLYNKTTNVNNGTLQSFGLTGATSNWVESYAMVMPVPTAASSITASGFTANWTAPVWGTVDNGYRLDVSTSSTFASAIAGSPFTVSSGTSQALTGLTSGTKYYYRVRADKSSVTGTGGYYYTIDSATTLSNAVITTTATLSAFTSCSGSASTQQGFTVSGTGLSADILVTPPTGFEVSTTSGSGFASSVTLTQSGGIVGSTTVYIRLTNAASGTPSGNIACTSTGATTQNVAASGTVTAFPTATAGGSQSICSNASTVAFAATSANGTIAWTHNGSGSLTNATTTVPTYAAQSGDGGHAVILTMTVTGTGTCAGQTAVATHTVNVLTAPIVPLITGPTTGCGYSSQNYSVSIPNGTSSYAWTAGSSTITAGQGTSSSTVYWTVTSGLGSVGVIETAANNCATSSSPYGTLLSTGANPVITGSATVCASSTSTYTLSTITSGRTYVWSVTGGTISGSNTGNSISVNWGATGAGIVNCSESVTSSSCTTIAAPYNVTKNPIPTATIGGGSTVCLNVASPNVTFTGANGTAPYTFTYNIDGGSNLTVVSVAATATVAVPTTSAGTHTYNLVSVVDASSTTCSQTQSGSTTFVINPIPTYNGGTSQTICSGTASSVSLTANTSGGTNSFAWTSSAVGGISGNSNSNGSTLAQTLTSINTTATNVAYSVTPTYTFNSVGCSGTAATVTVTVNPIPVNNGTSTQTICSGTASSVSLTANTTGGTNSFAYSTSAVSGLSGNSGSTGSSIAQTLSTTNTLPTNAVYSVTPTYTNNSVGCSGTPTSYTVTVNPIPVNTGTTSQTICSGTASSVGLSANTTGGTNSFDWTTSAVSGLSGNSNFTGVSIAQTLNTINTSATNAVYSVTPKFTNNSITCSGTATNATVTVNPIPLYTGATSQTICSGTASSASLTANTTGGTNTFAWTSSAVVGLLGNSASTGSTIAQTLSTTNTTPTNGVFVVTPTYTNNSIGCSGNTANVTITTNPLPVYTGTTSQTICSNSATNLSLSANTTGGTNTFAWTSASVSGLSGNVLGSGSSIAQTLTNTNLTASNAVYSIVSTFTNNAVACNNATNGSATVTVNPRPTASAGGSTTICSGQSTSVTGATANNGTITWTENGAGYISAGGTTVAPTYTSDALDAGNTVTLTMTVSGTGICTGQTANATYSIAVNPSPTPLVSGPATGCGYTSGTFTTPSNSGRTYTWTVSAPNTLVSGQGTNSINVFYDQASGSAVTGVTETITATGCQITSAFYNTNVNEGANPLASGSGSVCAGSTNTYSTTSEIGHTYSWSVSGGTISGSSTGNSISVVWGSAGAGSATVTETVTATSCSNSSTKNVTKNANPNPSATAGASMTTCANTPINITGASYSGTSVSWSVNTGNGSITAGGSTTTPTYTPALTDANTTVILTMTATDATASCGSSTATSNKSITVNPLPTASISGGSTVCINVASPNVTFTGANGTAPYTFTYNIDGGSNLTVISVAATATVAVPTTSAGTHTYNLVSVQDASSTVCSQTQMGSTTFVVNPLPTASAGGTQTICSNGTALVSGASLSNGTILWTHNGSGSISDETTLTPTYTAAVGDSGLTRTLTMTVTSNNACAPQTATATYSVVVNPLPTASIGGGVGGAVPSGYCTPTVAVPGATGDWVRNFTFNTLSNLNVPDNSTDFNLRSQTTTITAGSTYSISAQSGPVYGQGIGVWIDYNRNGVFTDAGEFVLSFAQSTSLLSSNITIPSSVSSGQTRMRVMAIFSIATSSMSCGHGFFGSYDDYIITISGAASQTICSNGTATISGASSSNGTILWTHNGSGSISDETTLTPTYTAAVGDAGLTRTLTMTVTSNNSCSPQTASATYSVIVNPLPTATAGGTQTICSNATATVSGASSSNGTILWTHNGSGSISDETTLTPTYTAAAGDAGLTRTLTMTVTSNNACAPQTALATYSVIVNPLPTATAGGTQTICSESGTALVSGASSSNGTILWSHNGSGSISGETTLTPTYTATAGDAGLTRTLTMTVTSNNACAPQNATATYSVVVNAPLANNSITSPQQSICIGATPTQITGSTATGGDGSSYTYSWESSTAGATSGFNPIASTNTINYSPSALTQSTWYRRTVSSGVCNPNSSSAIKIFVGDTIRPTVITKTKSTYLDASGNTSIVVSDIDDGSTDNCIISTRTLSKSSFTCSNVGTNTTYLRVTDALGNIDSASAIVTVIDTVRPVVTTQNINVQLNAAGTASIVGSQVNNGTTDACGIASYSVSSSTFNCSNVGTPVTVTMTATDVNGNSKTGFATVTVQDLIAPIVNTKTANVYLDAAGNASVTATQVDNSSTDNCAIATRSVLPNSFTCANRGNNTVTLTVTDVNTNSANGTATVNVLDTISPTISAANSTAIFYLGANGTAQVILNPFSITSADNCGAPTITFSPSVISCTDIGIKTVTITATDASGNSKSIFTTAVVLDPILPVARPKARFTTYLSASGQAIISPALLDSSSTDNCTITSIVLSQSTFNCTNVGTNNVLFTVHDQSGNAHAATVVVTVLDTILPVAIARNISVQLNSLGTATITGAQVNNGSSDFCGIASLTVSPATFNCSNIGANVITLTVTDNSGNIRTALATATVADTVKPIVITRNITVSLDATGNASITAADVNNGSSDACVIDSMRVTPNTFTCANRGANTVTLYVMDRNGNFNSATAIVTVQDIIKPTVITQNKTIQLTGGSANITVSDIDNGSSDNCAISTRVLSKSSFNCSNVGPNTIYLVVTDNSGNKDSSTAIVTVQDVTAPIAIAQNINAYLNNAGSVTITGAQVNNGSTDACGGLTFAVSPSSFNCTQTGANTVTLTVTDPSNNSSTATATVTVIDTVRPVVITRNLIVQLDATGNATITEAQVNNGSSDACGIATYSLNKTTFNCTNVGSNTVILTVTDNKGNIKTGTATVTIEDVTAPIAVAQNINAYLNAAGTVTVTGTQVDNGSSDACGISTRTVLPNTFGCANTGANAVVLTVTDVNGNASTANATVTVIDTIKPIVITQNITVQLDATGNATITTVQVNNGSSDACGIASVVLDKTSFNCTNVGPNTVTLTVTDNKGNIKTGTATVTIQDVTAPIAVAQNINAYLNAAGTVTVTGAQVNNGSSDACGGLTFAVAPNIFGCVNTGANAVVLTVTDANGNISTANATVTVIDSVKPTVITQNFTVQLNGAGEATITAAQVNNGSSDACGIASMSIDITSFNCTNTGANTVTLTVTDNKGNVKTGTAVVTIQDAIKPVVLTQNRTIYLNAAGNASITVANIDNGSSDNCSITTRTLSKSNFDCDNTGINTIYLRVTDASGNIDSASAIITVFDTIAPVVITQNITAPLNGAGTVTITGVQVDNGSNDACGIATRTVFPNTFNCSNVGTPVTVTLTVTDNKGNVKTGTAVVTISEVVKPVVIVSNPTIQLNAAGTALLTMSQVDNGSTDNCGIATRSLSKTNFNCANLGSNTVYLRVTDNYGNIDSAASIVTVQDGIKPIAATKDKTLYLDAAGNGSIVLADIENGSTDNCSISTRTLTKTSFNCSNVGSNNIYLRVTDAAGNIDSAIANVNVLDTIKPIVITRNITVILDSLGNGTITAAQVDNGSSDACPFTISVLPNTFACANVGNNTVVLTARDASNNARSAYATVTVIDTIKPVVITRNATAYLNASGTVIINAAQVNNGTSDACVINSLVVSPFTFNCSNIGNNTVTLTATDRNGNQKSETAVVNILDTVKPTAIAKNIIVYLNASGTASITGAQVNNNSTDNCSVSTLDVSPSTFTCANLGNNTVTLTATDGSGNLNTTTATVTVLDTIKPTVNTRNITAYLASNGSLTVTGTQVNNGSTDNCTINTLTVSPATFTCANIGANTVTLTVTDFSGNFRTGTAIVTISDTVRPVVITQNITVQLSSTGTASITAAQINNGSTDACGINTSLLSVSPNTFTCANTGANTVTLSVTDVNGNVKTGTAIVTVADTVRPNVIARNLTVYLGSTGTITLLGTQVNGGSTDACGIATYVVSPSTFTCSTLGNNNVVLTVTDNKGNVNTASAVITVLDTVRPAVVTRSYTAILSSTGTASITAANVTTSATDACGILSSVVSPTSFNCTNIGANTVTLTTTDVNGNIKVSTAIVTVSDTIGAVVVTQNRTLYLATNGSVSVTSALINNGSSDFCGIASMTVTPNILRCVNVGTNVVTLSVTDLGGNVRTGTATVTVLDTIKPTVITRNRTVYLNASGAASVTGADINNGSIDACGVSTITVLPNTFSCTNRGANTVTLTVTDVNGNFRTGTATVTVLDTIRPIAVAQNITAQLNSSGTVTITGALVNNGSSDICGISTLSVSPNTFTCSNIGTNNVVLTVTDSSGNVKTATAVVTIADTVRPVVNTQNITAQLNNLGTVTITASQVNNGSTDACGISTLAISPSTFSCSNIGNNTVTLTVTDVNGNVNTGTALVIVADTVRPVVNTQNITVQLNSSGAASITAAQVNNGSTDTCGISTLTVLPNTFNCSNIGANTVTLTVTDVNGNVKTGTAIVTVADTIRPLVVAQNITVQLSNLGTVSITGAQVTNSSSDICGIATRTVSPATFTCSNVGTNNVTLTVTDVNGNVTTRPAVVTVQDTVRPVVVTQNITAQLNNSGSVTITAAQVNNGSSDACGVSTLTVSPATFSCSNIGANTVTLTVTDVNGNIKTGTAVVTVADTVRPVVVTQNRNVYLSATGSGSITAAQINNGSTDSCGISTITVLPNTFSCSNIGANTVTLTVTDVNGNVKTGTATVTVLDTIKPVVITQNRTIYLNASGSASTTAALINNSSTDACGITSISLSQTSFLCSNVGANTVTLTVTDVNGNVNTGTATVTVVDTIKPTVNIVNGIVLYLNQFGTVGIAAPQFNNGSADNCGIASVSISPTTITCSDLGIKTVTLTVTDVNGNVNSANTNVVVIDPIAPDAKPKLTYTAYLSANGQAIINPGLLDSASTDNCSITNKVLSQSVFNCTHTGLNNIIFSVQDQSGNSDSAIVMVTVLDTIAPTATVSNQSVYLNANGVGSITAAQVNNNSTDNCSVATVAISKNSFNCSDLGSNNITFTVTDINGNIKTRSVIVNVFDTIRPVMRPKQSLTVYLGSAGNASISVANVDSSSSDNCGVTIRTLSQSNFTCSNVGLNIVTLNGQDTTGNIGSRTFSVTVLDTVKPLLTTKSATIYLGATGNVALTASQVILSSSDNCSSTLTNTISQSTFTCSNLGSNLVSVTVTDASGNFRTINASVTVLDTVRPNVLTQNRTIYLNSVGTASLTAAQVNNGTTDNCTLQSTSISKTSYTAADLGINNITFTATDNSSNSQTVNVIITVLDTVRPVISAQNRTIYLNASGSASVTAAQVNNGSTDNVGITNLLLSRTAFSCADLGSNLVTLTATDISNNSTSATAMIFVLDTIKPVVVSRNLTLYLNGIGQASITPAQINNGSADNCSIATYSLSKSLFDCTDRGINTNIITLTVTDASGNTSTATATISVLDTIKPNIVVNNNLNLYLDANGSASLTTAQVNNGSTDNCGITTLALSKTTFNGTNLGLNVVSFTATDASGNSQSVNVNVIINDTVVPIIIARNKTLYLNAFGSAVLTPNDVDNGSTDNVGITTKTVNKTLFNCNDAGLNLVEFFVSDISGNRSSAIVTVTVLDTILPVVNNVSANVILGYCGADFITVIPTATDNCGAVTISQTTGVTPGNKYPVGVTTNTFTFEDKSGNKVTRSYTVTITPRYVPDSLPNITICSSVPKFNLTPTNAKGIYTFSGSGVTLDGKMYDPALSGSGNYNVTYTFIDSSLCATQGNFFVTVNRAPDKPVIDRITADVLKVQQQFNFYQWLRYGQPIAGATSQSYTTTRSGLYSVKVSTNEGCTTESDPYALGVNVGVNNVNTQVGFKMYPNPSLGLLYIELDEQDVKQTNVKVFDALGKLVYETEINKFITQLDLSNVADGTYFVRLTQDGKTSVKPIVITK